MVSSSRLDQRKRNRCASGFERVEDFCLKIKWEAKGNQFSEIFRIFLEQMCVFYSI